MHEDSSLHRVRRSDDEVDKWLPFTDYALRLLPFGMPINEIMNKFVQIVEEHETECRFIRGEWCVPVFMGCEGRRGQSWEQTTSLTRSSRIESATDLQRMQDTSRSLQQAFLTTNPAPLTIAPMMEAPAINAQPADQPTGGTTQVPMTVSIQREVNPTLIMGTVVCTEQQTNKTKNTHTHTNKQNKSMKSNSEAVHTGHMSSQGGGEIWNRWHSHRTHVKSRWW